MPDEMNTQQAADGGPAFPRPASEFTKNGSLLQGDEAAEPQAGMSLRDYFAAKAIVALVADEIEEMNSRAGKAGGLRTGFDDRAYPTDAANEYPTTFAERVVADAYIIADAMLVARKPFTSPKDSAVVTVKNFQS